MLFLFITLVKNHEVEVLIFSRRFQTKNIVQYWIYCCFTRSAHQNGRYFESSSVNSPTYLWYWWPCRKDIKYFSHAYSGLHNTNHYGNTILELLIPQNPAVLRHNISQTYLHFSFTDMAQTFLLQLEVLGNSKFPDPFFKHFSVRHKRISRDVTLLKRTGWFF